MQTKLNLSPWEIDYTHKPSEPFYESIFFTGNGKMGARAYLPFENTNRPIDMGIFVAGIFGEIKSGITDFVNLPTPIYEEIYIDDKKATVSGLCHTTLDLGTGEIKQKYSVSSENKTIDIIHRRFFSLKNKNLLAQKTTLITKDNALVKVVSGINVSSCNCTIPDDQTKDNFETIKLSKLTKTENKPLNIACEFLVNGTNLIVNQKTRFKLLHDCTQIAILDELENQSNVFYVDLKKCDDFSLEKFTTITTSRDYEKNVEPSAFDYSTLLDENNKTWQEHWDNSDIEIDGPTKDQAAIRYAIFQLIANCSSDDPTVSIGARGITHTRYKGCYFWDTDVFMHPFYIYTNPKAAKNLAMYRVNTLQAAKEHSEKMNTKGARYPWMTAFDGKEQCETWDIGASELHITCDVVYSLDNYIKSTGDMKFWEKYAIDVYIETARFWISRYSIHSDGSADLMFCKGPDEYCGITSNNLYTNTLVKLNLELAMKAANHLNEHDENRFNDMNLSVSEIESWKNLHDNIKLPKNNDRYLQDDTFHKLEDVNIKEIKADDSASYHTVCFDRLQRYKVIKQADVVLLMSRLPHLFTEQEKLYAWEDFEPLCLHDSTLSFASHALFAGMIGDKEKTSYYLQKALFLDLFDVMGNTGKEGLHLANFGEIWSAIIFGVLGLTFTDGEPKVNLNFPEGWNKVTVNIIYKGEKHTLSCINVSAQ